MFSVAARDSCSIIRLGLVAKTTSLAAAVCSQGNRPIGQTFHASHATREKAFPLCPIKRQRWLGGWLVQHPPHLVPGVPGRSWMISLSELKTWTNIVHRLATLE